MPFGAHETMEVHEILNEKINMINHFSMYAEQAQSEQVRGLIRQHLQTAIGHYDQLVAYTHDYEAAGGLQGSWQPVGESGMNGADIRYGLRQPQPVAPQLQAQSRLNDRQILSAVLCCHKNSAKNAMQASLECADPNVRQMLLSGAIAANQHAYDTFLLMNRQGFYQVPTMQDHTAKTYLHTYQPMNAAPNAHAFQ